MKTSHYRALPALALAALCGCHSRVPVIGSAPTYHFRELSQEGVLGKKMDEALMQVLGQLAAPHPLSRDQAQSILDAAQKRFVTGTPPADAFDAAIRETFAAA